MPIKQRTIDYVQDTRLLVARAREFERRGAAAEALVAYDMAGSLISGLPPGAFHADLYRWKGTLLRDIGETASAACLLKRSLDIAHYVLYADGVAQAQNALASVYLRRGDVATARQLYSDASANAAAASDQRLYALIEQSLGTIAQMQGDAEGARIRYHMSLRALRATGDDEGTSWALHRIGLLHVESGRYEDAAQAFDQAEELSAARGDRLMQARLALGRAAMMLAAGKLDEAEQQHARAMAMTERRHERPLRVEALLTGARVKRARGALEPAATTLSEARELAAQSEDVLALATALAELGDLRQELGEYQLARESWEEALACFSSLGATREAVTLQQRLATPRSGRSQARSS